MNEQNILHNQGSNLGIRLDGSELYDFELVVLNVDVILDYSEYYDYELVQLYSKIDMVLDYSEFYDYTLGDNSKDYIIPIIEIIDGNYIITDNGFILTTDDNYYIEYY
jgi:hypothetical protein